MTPEEAKDVRNVDAFILGDVPLAAWSEDIDAQNAFFIESLNPDYYIYLAEKYIEDIDGENSFHAATALRTIYFQCMENMFALLFSYIQSARCQLPYILKYRNEIDKLILGM